MTAAKVAVNTLLKVTVSAALTLIAEVINITGPNMKAGTIDVTSQDSTDREFIGDTLADGGEVTFEVNYKSGDAGQKQMFTLLKSGAVAVFTLVFNDGATTGTTITFNGIVTGFSPSAQLGQAYKNSLTVKVASIPTIADAV